MTRNPINWAGSLTSILVALSEGNPGAATVVAQMAQLEGGLLALMNLDDFGIRGSQIWVGYKEFCNQDADLFIVRINKRDMTLIDGIRNFEKGEVYGD